MPWAAGGAKWLSHLGCPLVQVSTPWGIADPSQQQKRWKKSPVLCRPTSQAGAVQACQGACLLASCHSEDTEAGTCGPARGEVILTCRGPPLHDLGSSRTDPIAPMATPTCGCG
ncbi:hypothetical protein VULLAG_LOCUS12754 [Vulpes lagopus]